MPSLVGKIFRGAAKVGLKQTHLPDAVVDPLLEITIGAGENVAEAIGNKINNLQPDAPPEELKAKLGAVVPVDPGKLAAPVNRTDPLEITTLRTLEEAKVLCLIVRSDNHAFACGTAAGQVKIYDLPANNDIKCTKSFRGHSGEIRGVAFDPAGKYLAIAGKDKTVKLWETVTWKQFKKLDGHVAPVTCVAISPDNQFLASGDEKNKVLLCDMRSYASFHFDEHKAKIQCLAFSPDGRFLASGADNRKISLRNVSVNGSEPVILEGHKGAVLSVAFSPGGHFLASGSSDKHIRLWEVSTGKVVADWQGGTRSNDVRALTFSADGTFLISGGSDKAIYLWSIGSAAPQLIYHVEEHKAAITALAISSDNRVLISSSEDNTVKVWKIH